MGRYQKRYQKIQKRSATVRDISLRLVLSRCLLKYIRDCNYILVYDLGGGTLDVTVLELFEGVVDVRPSCGNNTLSRKDFDEALMDHIVDIIQYRDRVNISTDPRAMIRVKNIAEQCEIALSDSEAFEVEIPFLYRKGN